MTDELKALIEDVTCRLCNGEGRLFSRVAHSVGGEVALYDTERPCPLCGGFGYNNGGLK